MDNFSHALSGLAVGELIHRCLQPEADSGRQAHRRRLLLVTGLLAGNFPDLDLVLTPLLPEPLGYLLHHRGHTHTLLYAFPQALLLAATLLLLWPAARQLVRQSRAALGGFCLTLAAAFLVHLGMDYLNSYGVHPFYPLDTRWLYGDMVFIIEPMFWVTLGVPLFMLLQPRRTALLSCAALIGVIAYFSQAGFLSWSSFGALAAIAAALLGTQYISGRRGWSGIKGAGGLLAGITVCMLYIGGQGMASASAKRMVVDALETRSPGTRVLDVAMTPFPAHPICWMFASIEYRDDISQAQRGVLSLMPERLAAADCPPGLVQVPDELRDGYSGPAILTTYRGSVAELAALHEENCHLRAWMRFARIPVLSETRAWDLRFERGGDNFTLIDLAAMPRGECPRGVPQWGKPRQDLLDASR